MRLRDELDRIAETAPPVGDAADRALVSARRYRRRVQLPIAVAAVAVAVALIGGVILRPVLLGTDIGPAKKWNERTEIPTTAEPLPGKGVSPARMAYLWNCSTDLIEPTSCLEARVMTQDNRHWVVRDVRPRIGSFGPRDPAITLSPDGKRIVYTDGTRFVQRELASGKVTDLVTVAPADNLSEHMAWSQDSRWLVLCFTGDVHQRSTLIDTTTKQVIPLDGWPLGVPNGAAVMPFVDTGRVDGAMTIPLRDRSGVSRGTIPASVVDAPGQFTPAGVVSPDGGTATIVFAAGEGRPRIRVVGVDPARAIDQITFGVGDKALAHPYVLGWPDDSRFVYATHWQVDAWTMPIRHELDVFDARTGGTRRLTELVGNAQTGTVSVATDLL